MVISLKEEGIAKNQTEGYIHRTRLQRQRSYNQPRWHEYDEQDNDYDDLIDDDDDSQTSAVPLSFI